MDERAVFFEAVELEGSAEREALVSLSPDLPGHLP
jgi:hypothetical protein